jgi:hypothetical protein
MHGSQMMYAILLIISHALASAGCDGAAGSLEVERLGDNLAGCDPVLTALFTPRQPEIGRYEVCTSPSPLERAIADQTADGFQFSAIERLEPADAFGTAGAYDRFALARLYGGQRVRVARGWRQRGVMYESATVLSPYPDPTLSRLTDGAMTIRWRWETGELTVGEPAGRRPIIRLSP